MHNFWFSFCWCRIIWGRRPGGSRFAEVYPVSNPVNPFVFPLCLSLSVSVSSPLVLSFAPGLLSSRMGRVVIRPGQPSPALLPDRCQQGAAALARVSPTTTAPREWGNQARVIYADPEQAGHHVSAWSVHVCVCVFLWLCTRLFRIPPLLQHPAINLLWHVKLNLWANLLATDMFNLKSENKLEWEWHLELSVSPEITLRDVYPLAFSCCVNVMWTWSNKVSIHSVITLYIWLIPGHSCSSHQALHSKTYTLIKLLSLNFASFVSW